MEISKAREAKLILERAILKLLRDFEAETGLVVDSVDAAVMNRLGYGQMIHHVDVRASIVSAYTVEGENAG